ncbi:MAG: hypothetical protein U0800_27265 [Isosphaeraceae bacterium]
MDASDAELDTNSAVHFPRSTIFGSAWRGAKAGFLWDARIGGAIGLLVLIAALLPTAYGLGALRGFSIHPLAFQAVVGFLISLPIATLLGTIFGIAGWMIGIIREVIEAVWPRSKSKPKVQTAPTPSVGDSPYTQPTVPSQPTSAELWRLWAWSGIPVAVILAATAGVGFYQAWIIDQRLAEAIAVTEEVDPRWRLDDVLADRESVSDEENSAPIVARAAAMVPFDWPDPPFSASPSKEPTELQVAMERLFREVPTVQFDDRTVEIVRAELDRYAEAVRLARTVADYRRGSHQITIGPAIIDTLLMETNRARTLGKLLGADAAIRAQEGDIDGALKACRAILGISRSIGDEPFLPSVMIRFALWGETRRAALRAISQGEASDPALAAFQADILEIKEEPILERCLRAERAMLDELILRVRNGKVPADGLDGFDPKRPVPSMPSWAKLAFDLQRAVGLEWMNTAMAIVEQPIDERPLYWQSWEAEIDRVRNSRFERKGAIIPYLMTIRIVPTDSARSRYQTEQATMALLIAAERHRRKTGQWPESIESIDPEILPVAPLDPFSGEPFRVTRVEGKFLVHSVGYNGIDDGGEYDPNTWRLGIADDVGAAAWDVALRGRPPSESLEPDPDTEGERFGCSRVPR